MTQEEIQVLSNRKTYLIKLTSGQEVFPVRWDKDQEHFYHYIDNKQYRKDFEKWDSDNQEPGMPCSAVEAEVLYCPPSRKPKQYRVYKPKQVLEAVECPF